MDQKSKCESLKENSMGEAMICQMEALETKAGSDFDIAYRNALAEHHAMA